MKTLLRTLAVLVATLSLVSCVGDPFGSGPGYGYGPNYNPGYYNSGYYQSGPRVVERDRYIYVNNNSRGSSSSVHHEHCYCSHKSCGCHPGHPKSGCNCDGGRHRH